MAMMHRPGRSLFRFSLPNRWVVWAFATALLLMGPLLVVFAALGKPSDEIWHHIVVNLLGTYTTQTVLLMVGVALLSFVFGVNAAWVVTMYRFPGRRFLEWALIMPLAIPAYLSGYAWAGMLDYTSPLYTFLRNHFGINTGQYLFFDLLSLPGAIFIFSLALYPYVYLITKTFFRQQAPNMLDAARSLGLGPWAVYRRLGLPLARPAIVAGISLILMEVLNDYGLVKYFGVETFTTGIFTAWFAFANVGAALKLSAILMVFVLVLIVVEKYQRRNLRFAGSAISGAGGNPRKARYGWVMTLLIALPVVGGFMIPLFAFLYWSVAVHDVISWDFGQLLFNSFRLAAMAALGVTLLALLLGFTLRTFPGIVTRLSIRVATLGYAIPGAVVAIGLLVITLWIDRHGSGLILLTGSLTALVYAYMVRFMAVGFNSIESGNERLPIHIDQAARSLGASVGRTFLRINLPLLRGPLVAAFLLVFIDVLKELPLTLILRPFNFDTLAIRAFEYANDERVAEASPAALVIIAAGIIPVILLNKIMKHKYHPKSSAE
jgi:iron(III) transport system permease protein